MGVPKELFAKYRLLLDLRLHPPQAFEHLHSCFNHSSPSTPRMLHISPDTQTIS